MQSEQKGLQLFELPLKCYWQRERPHTHTKLHTRHKEIHQQIGNHLYAIYVIYAYQMELCNLFVRFSFDGKVSRHSKRERKIKGLNWIFTLICVYIEQREAI